MAVEQKSPAWHRRAADVVNLALRDRGVTKDPSPLADSAREIYFGLLADPPDEAINARSRRFLVGHLRTAARQTCDLPATVEELPAWMSASTARVGQQYQRYLAERRSGEPRHYFATRAQALHFLRSVAPTKLVDGAWLYGLVAQWRDQRFAELIRIYLEELGDGQRADNHVVIYRRLLARHDCDWSNLDESHFVQGAIQLALARHAREFLPEIVGFNLGYEQLPLHLLITAYELNELGIDPYYFTLHITVDNAASGHAARAVQAVLDAMPRLGDREDFYRRVCNGYQLNALGAGTTDIIASFDLEREVKNILATKARVGALLHSDYCRIAGRTVNDWLSNPEQIEDFIQALQNNGWIRRHESPENSRFWRLLEGDSAPMFGVFTNYERQVIRDWITGDARSLAVSGARFRRRPGTADMADQDGDFAGGEDFAAESRLLRDRIAQCKSRSAALDMLVPFLSPAHHHTETGLQATRLFSELLRS